MFAQTNKSAIKTHYLSSILPFNPMITEPEHLTKTKDFYKPEQFIWNNPHRTSKRMYPYYHKFNETYHNQVKPQVDKQEEEDRRQAERRRIQKLSNLRRETRLKFYSRQKGRESLEMKSGNRRKQHSTLQVNKKSNNSTIENYLNNDNELMNIYSNRDLDRKGKSRTTNTNNQMKTVSILERSYIQKVDSYDQNLKEIQKLMAEQMSSNHNKIRTQFQKRKTANETSFSRIKKGLTVPSGER